MKKLVKLNEIVSMYKKPVLGSVSGKIPIMAFAVDEHSKKNIIGIARVITKRKGNPNIPGFLDKSKLILVKSKDKLNRKKDCDLKIKGIEQDIKERIKDDRYFIGLEDPDIFTDEKRIKHVYFTIAYKLKNKKGYEIFLGHAKGKSLKTLESKTPPLRPMNKYIKGFKETTISPEKIKKGRLNLNEVILNRKGVGSSCISVSLAKDMNKQWRYLRIVLDPRKINHKWVSGEASPCCFLPKNFINPGKGLFVLIINGREKRRYLIKRFGRFRPGLALFNPKTGEIPWVDSQPLFEDPKAKTITFASDFIQASKDKGILYAHVNDSFVRAYEINAKELKKYLKDRIKL